MFRVRSRISTNRQDPLQQELAFVQDTGSHISDRLCVFAPLREKILMTRAKPQRRKGRTEEEEEELSVVSGRKRKGEHRTLNFEHPTLNRRKFREKGSPFCLLLSPSSVRCSKFNVQCSMFVFILRRETLNRRGRRRVVGGQRGASASEL